MKKISTKQKKRNIKLSKKRFERNLRSKQKRKNKRKKIFPEKVLKYRSKKYKIINAPENYSLIENTENFIRYLNKAKEIAKQGYGIKFDLSNISNLTFDALCLLMATTKNKKIFGKVKGTIPQDPKLKDFFLNSGFVKRLAEDDLENNSIGGEMYNQISNKSYSSVIDQKCTKTIIEYTYSGDRIGSPPIHPAFVESMKNTDDHAGKGYDRWLFYYKDHNKITKVCFLDLGKGILGTLNNKLDEFVSNISSIIFQNEKDAKKLKMLFEGEVSKTKYRTSTNLSKRGTGLKNIGDFIKHPKVNKGFVITNNVKGNIKESNYDQMSIKFNGTFYYWELHP